MRQDLSSGNRAGGYAASVLYLKQESSHNQKYTRLHNFKDELMPTIVKVLLLCVLCVGLITGIVYLVKWLW